MGIDIRKELSRKDSEFTQTEKKIATYILNKGHNFSQMSSTEVAEELGVGQSTIIKFVKKCGFNGFMDFKIQLSQSFVRDENILPLTHDDISLEAPLEDVAKAIVSESISALTKSFDIMDLDSFNQAIEWIDSSPRIYICGKGSSTLPAQDLSSKLMKLGLPVLWYQDLESVEAASLSADKQALFIVFSFSGETKEIVRILQNAKKNNAKIILVTKNVKSTMGKLAGLTLEIISNETIFRTAAMSSRIAFFSIVDILFLGIIKKDLKHRLKMIRDVYTSIG
ncbi:MurR/RpiR family transcriptional regulator [Clostridium sp. AF19-22AC]|jgi:DNA-binding MurR/RpiR family transcriptional regulator|uniref:MurR/RpiR family transcriptional regulator n=1 Tax=Clostridia TaxID=186801 RepID=UPI000E4A8849|nr:MULTISPECIES: MurR/RpiR family transcriptional regulator [Clostridia]RHR28159.1 MurR/RpiR family transcriptional regulator [Clostridium sp. AF19-22AC]